MSSARPAWRSRALAAGGSWCCAFFVGCGSTAVDPVELRRRYEDFESNAEDERLLNQVRVRFDREQPLPAPQALALEDVLLDVLRRHPCHLGVLRALLDVRRCGDLPNQRLEDLACQPCAPQVERYLEARTAADPVEARTHLDAALELDPDFPHARALRGLLELGSSEGRLGRAIRDLEAAQRSFPEDRELLRALAEAHERRLDPAGALPVYRELLQRDPADRDVRVNLGLALLALGEWREAEMEFRRVQSEDPARADAWHARGAAFVRGSQEREAERIYLAMLERFPADLEVHFSLGGLYFDGPLRDRARSERHYRAFLAALEANGASSPNHRAALTYLADIERDRGAR
ncbi:MAG: tetratricopeptide repeat protein [Planctomycetes bacterium]|nr:tetratricopeptide repeat protein [Planctomycetota bacterium]